MFYTFATINALPLGESLLLDPIHVSKWNNANSSTWLECCPRYKRFVAAVTVHSSRTLLESKRHNYAAIAIASDHN